MRDRNLIWALAAAAGIVYLATRAAEQQTPAPGEGPTQPNVSSSEPLELPLSAAAGPAETFPTSTPAFAAIPTLESRTAQYNRDFLESLTAIDGQRENGRILEIDGPVL